MPICQSTLRTVLSGGAKLTLTRRTGSQTPSLPPENTFYAEVSRICDILRFRSVYDSCPKMRARTSSGGFSKRVYCATVVFHLITFPPHCSPWNTGEISDKLPLSFASGNAPVIVAQSESGRVNVLRLRLPTTPAGGSAECSQSDKVGALRLRLPTTPAGGSAECSQSDKVGALRLRPPTTPAGGSAECSQSESDKVVALRLRLPTTPAAGSAECSLSEQTGLQPVHLQPTRSRPDVAHPWTIARPKIAGLSSPP